MPQFTVEAIQSIIFTAIVEVDAENEEEAKEEAARMCPNPQDSGGAIYSVDEDVSYHIA